jgi:hypothetical protein
VRGREEIAGRIGDVIAKRLIARRFIEVKDEARVKQAIQRVIVDNLVAEEQLDVEARRILQGYARDIRDQGLDYRQLFTTEDPREARA